MFVLQVMACSGVTRERRVLFYDYVNRAPLVAIALQARMTRVGAAKCGKRSDLVRVSN
jgi:hypothetical protein